MKQISTWAKLHSRTARIIIIILYVPLNIAGFITGRLLGENNIFLGEKFLLATAIITLGLWIFDSSRLSFIKRKLCHAIMITCTYCFIVFFGNQVYNPKPVLPFIVPVQAVGNNNLLRKTNLSDSANYSVKHFAPKTIIQKKDKKPMPVWLQILLCVLVVLAALGLFYLLAALSCGIACNGSEALAIIVLLAGTFGIVFGTIKLFRRILKGKKKRKNISEEKAG